MSFNHIFTVSNVLIFIGAFLVTVGLIASIVSVVK